MKREPRILLLCVALFAMLATGVRVLGNVAVFEEGFVSTDGGITFGPVVMHTDGGYVALTISGGTTFGSVVELPADRTIKQGIFTFGVIANEFQTNAPARIPSLTTNGTTGGYVSSATTGDGITAVAGGYTRALKDGVGAPAGADCDAAGEVMRTYYDTASHIHYVCEGAAGWFKSGAYAP